MIWRLLKLVTIKWKCPKTSKQAIQHSCIAPFSRRNVFVVSTFENHEFKKINLDKTRSYVIAMGFQSETP